VIVYRLLSGEYPCGPIPSDLPPLPLAQCLLERLKLGFQPLRRLCPDLERPVAAILERCLAVDPDHRPTATALALELKRQFSPLRRTRRWLAARPRTVLATMGLLLLAALVAGFAWSTLPPYSEREYRRAEAAYHAGDYDEAEKHFDGAVQADPTNLRFRFARGCARLKQSKTLPENQAKDKLDQAWGDIRSTTDERLDAPQLATKAYQHNRGHNPDKAILCYDLLRQTAYYPVMVLNNRAYTYIQRKEFKKARIDLDQAAQLDPNCQAVFYNRAMLACYEQMDAPSNSSLPPQALDDIERAIQLGPPSPMLYRDAALLYAQSLWLDRSHALVSLDTPIVAAFHFRMRQQRSERALAYLRQAIAEGWPFASIAKNYYFQRALRSHPAFADLHQIQPRPATTPPIELRLIDPIDLPN
jgi:tetratricopeptide (TPR) repeat protein